MLEQNLAPTGKSIYMTQMKISASDTYVNGILSYRLPAPPGRYLDIPKGITLNLLQSVVNEDFPYACPAGVVGGNGSNVDHQSDARCKEPW